MINVLVVDDQNVFREGVAALISRDPEISVIGQASNGKDAFDFVQNNPQTNVVLMDYRMPEMNGLIATEKIKGLGTNTEVVLLTMYQDEDFVKEALLAGAKSILSKDNEPDEINRSIKEAYAGKYYLPSSGIGLLVQKLKQYADTGIDERNYKITDSLKELLSDREELILNYIMEGDTSETIAEKLNLSKRTVETHKTNMLAKARAKNVAHLVALAIQDSVQKAFLRIDD